MLGKCNDHRKQRRVAGHLVLVLPNEGKSAARRDLRLHARAQVPKQELEQQASRSVGQQTQRLV